jgi:hypothetical protein
MSRPLAAYATKGGEFFTKMTIISSYEDRRKTARALYEQYGKPLEADHKGEGIVKLTAERKNTFHSVTISSGSEALTSHLGIYNGLEMTSTSHSTTLFCRFDR